MKNRTKVLVFGAAGFIGKNLCRELAGGDFEVSVFSRNISKDDQEFFSGLGISNIIDGDIVDAKAVGEAVRYSNCIFSLAGSSGASDSIRDPYIDLNSNLRGHLNILESCRMHNPSALLVFPSSRLVYGKLLSNPVNEQHPLQPESIYAIHKITTEHYYLLYQRLYGINCIIFRIANPYGPYQEFGSNHYGILNWFVHNALTSKSIEIFGDGSQVRDFIHIDDLVKLMVKSIDESKLFGGIFNVGTGLGMTLKKSAERIAGIIGGVNVSYKPWPEIDRKIETGDYISDIGLLRSSINWQATKSFDEGLKETIRHYEGHGK